MYSDSPQKYIWCVCIYIFFLILTVKIWMRCYCRPSWIATDHNFYSFCNVMHAHQWVSTSWQAGLHLRVNQAEMKCLAPTTGNCTKQNSFFLWFWCRKPEVSKLAGTIVLQISGLACILGSVRSCNEEEVFTHNKDEVIWLFLPWPTSQRAQAWWCEFERDSERTNPGTDMLTLMLTRGHLQPHQTAVLSPDLVF